MQGVPWRGSVRSCEPRPSARRSEVAARSSPWEEASSLGALPLGCLQEMQDKGGEVAGRDRDRMGVSRVGWRFPDSPVTGTTKQGVVV